MKQELVLLLLVLGGSSGIVVKTVPHGISEVLESTHLFDVHASESAQYGNKLKLLKEVTITKNIPVPYPVKVERHVPIPVQIPFPVTVEKKIPILVERKIPIYVQKPVPMQVDRPFPYPLPVQVPVYHKMAVEVPKPYPVHVPNPYPVYIQKSLYAENKKKKVINGNKVKLVKH